MVYSFGFSVESLGQGSRMRGMCVKCLGIKVWVSGKRGRTRRRSGDVLGERGKASGFGFDVAGSGIWV